MTTATKLADAYAQKSGELKDGPEWRAESIAYHAGFAACVNEWKQ